MKLGGNGLKKRVTALVQAYFYLKSFAVSNIFVANYQSLRANCYHKIRLIELFWNQWASDQNLMLVVCGSATSWMVNKLLGDKGGLHNRVTRSIYLAPFSLGELRKFYRIIISYSTAIRS